MRIAICDDNWSCRALVTDLLHEYVDQHRNRSLSFVVFSEPEALLEAHQAKPFDIYILDIVMPGMNGIELGTALRSDCADARIIFLTSSEEYAVESFRLRAFHYLIKPVRQDTLFPALDEAVASVAIRRDRSLIVKTKDGSARLTFDSILYAELARRAVVYYLKDGTTVESTSLRIPFVEAVGELLRDRRFAPCGASMAVNLHHIAQVATENLRFETGLQLHLSKKTCRELRAVWNDYWLNEESSL